MKRSLLVLSTLMVLPDPIAAQSANWTRNRSPVQIADNLYYVGTQGLAAFLFTSSEGHILIDAPLYENVPRVRENIWRAGFDPADVRVQLASHAHYDHVGGLSAMGEVTGAELVMSEADAALVREGRDFALETYGYRPAVADRTVGHLDTVRVGDLELTAHLTPGHTPGCTTWSGTVPIEGEPFGFVSVCSLSVQRGHRLVGDDATYPGLGADFCWSLAYLEAFDPDIFIGPHASWFGLEEKAARLAEGDRRAFVGGGEYRAYLREARASIEQALREEGLVGGCAALLAHSALSATSGSVRAARRAGM